MQLQQRQMVRTSQQMQRLQKRQRWVDVAPDACMCRLPQSHTSTGPVHLASVEAVGCLCCCRCGAGSVRVRTTARTPRSPHTHVLCCRVLLCRLLRTRSSRPRQHQQQQLASSLLHRSSRRVPSQRTRTRQQQAQQQSNRQRANQMANRQQPAPAAGLEGLVGLLAARVGLEVSAAALADLAALAALVVSGAWQLQQAKVRAEGVRLVSSLACHSLAPHHALAAPTGHLPCSFHMYHRSTGLP